MEGRKIVLSTFLFLSHLTPLTFQQFPGAGAGAWAGAGAGAGVGAGAGAGSVARTYKPWPNYCTCPSFDAGRLVCGVNGVTYKHPCRAYCENVRND